MRRARTLRHKGKALAKMQAHTCHKVGCPIPGATSFPTHASHRKRDVAGNFPSLSSRRGFHSLLHQSKNSFMEPRRRRHLQLKAAILTTTIGSLKVKTLFVVRVPPIKVLQSKKSACGYHRRDSSCLPPSGAGLPTCCHSSLN